MSDTWNSSQSIGCQGSSSITCVDIYIYKYIFYKLSSKGGKHGLCIQLEGFFGLFFSPAFHRSPSLTLQNKILFSPWLASVAPGTAGAET